MKGVYKPAEDSNLLLRHAEPRVHGDVLEMGTGTGFIAVELAPLPQVETIVAADIDPTALEETRKRAAHAGVAEKIEPVHTDLFQNLGGRRFDWILFNPPYLPSEGAADEPSWTGGETGRETVVRFLREAPDHLHPGGKALLVISSQTGLEIGEIKGRYMVEILETLPLFYERLSCLLLEPFSPSGRPGRTRR